MIYGRPSTLSLGATSPPGPVKLVCLVLGPAGQSLLKLQSYWPVVSTYLIPWYDLWTAQYPESGCHQSSWSSQTGRSCPGSSWTVPAQVTVILAEVSTYLIPWYDLWTALYPESGCPRSSWSSQTGQSCPGSSWTVPAQVTVILAGSVYLLDPLV